MAIPGNLYISVDFGSSPTMDDGTRPYTGTNPQWNNFSMFLKGGPNDTQTRVGTPTTVQVRVSNKDKATPVQAVKVDAYVMNPFLGISQPQQSIRRLSGTVGSVGPGSGSSSPTDAHVVTCMIQDPVQGPLPWTPTQAELDTTHNGDGHLCLVANVYADGDGHPLLDAENLDVVNDQHQGQRNIQLLAKVTNLVSSAGFLVMPVPEEMGPQETVVQIERVDPKLALGAGELALLRSQEGIVYDKNRRRLFLWHKGRLVPLHLVDADPVVKATVEGFGKLGGKLPAFVKPLTATVELAIGPQERVGAIQVFDFVQRSKQQELGRIRMVTLVTG